MPHLRRGAVALVAAAALATAGLTVARADSRSAEVLGIVLSVNAADGAFRFREFATDLVWSAFLHRDVEVEREKDRDGGRYRLAPGDIVEVKGTVLATRTILARKIKVLGHSASPSGPVAPPAPSGDSPSGASAASLIKVIGVGMAVRAFAPALNTFINEMLQARDAQTRQTTKVVPILSVSIGINAPGNATIGAAQVAGAADAVARVQAVAALDGNFQGTFSVRALVPVDSLEPWKQVRRVPGVGVSAIIDLKI
ncbi:MAG: hypothetical protein QN155_11615 [Armatimonadota bacterium]|nr:hypothetical protein [Armatimonadota bacterium]MDR7404778.1 hypothetical protein [Armatimonadota bacterium]